MKAAHTAATKSEVYLFSGKMILQCAAEALWGAAITGGPDSYLLDHICWEKKQLLYSNHAGKLN